MDEVIARIRTHQTRELLRESRPWLFYTPHPAQRLFHQAQHIYRLLFPGNGWGKTRAAGTEIAWWVYHCHPYQKTPLWPPIIIWCAETYKQFEILREQLQAECLGPERQARHPNGWRFNKSDKCYTWPDGARLFLVSGDSSWTHIQGVPVDLVEFDEEPPWPLFNELAQRRRGRRKTRYMMSATATQGLTWTYHRLYRPWLEWYSSRGLTLDQAIAIQNHPMTWLLERGGIDQNPGADAEDRAYYRMKSYASEAEKTVRLYGGFRDFAGYPVFDPAALGRMRDGLMDGETGRLVRRKERSGKRPPVYAFVPDGPMERGRITIFRHPDPTRRYVIGHDSAWGLDGKDYDYATVWDRTTGEQVAEAQGHWGDVHWADVLESLHYYYGGAFLCGEKQCGLPTMRRLYDERGIGYQYYDRDEASRVRRKSDTLGHFRRTGDLVISHARVAIAGRVTPGLPPTSEITIRSRELWRQASLYQWQAINSTKRYDEIEDSSRLTTGAPSGDHDDAVMSMVYSVLAMREVGRFEAERPVFEPGTAGEDMAAVFAVPKKQKHTFNYED